MKKYHIITFILLLVAHLSNAEKYKNEEIISSFDNLSSITENCEGYEQMKQTGNPLLSTSDEDRGFVLRNSTAIIKLYAAQSPLNTTSGTATIQGLVRYETESNGHIVERTQEISLSVSVNLIEFKDVDYVKIENAISVTVEFENPTNFHLFSDIKVSISCEGDIYRFLPPSAKVSGLRYTNPQTNPNGGLVDGNLYVSWDNLVDQSNSLLTNAGVEYYELEWTYISNQGTTPTTTISKSDVISRYGIFKNNSSRVSTTNKGYFIPLVYEKGWIVFRVRPVGKSIVDGKLTDVKGGWTVTDNGTSLSEVIDDHIFTFAGLENKLNWQSSISFAEEGKNKTVISYHDGSLRNRQAVTKINSDDRVVAGETYYDYNGRPVIQTLPVPLNGTNEKSLNYRPNLNPAEGKTKLEKADYDRAEQGQGCTPIAPVLDDSYGSSKYYSSNNSFDTQGNTGNNIINKDYIPKADGYPYTQTRYMNDNTGRIAAQSGVGSAHVLGSGHETKYLYGVPLQSEITRLFGTQVGLSAHYKKNTVIDPNGQVSVSYLDLDGKVIATALAGGNPTGLDNLPGESTREISSNLINAASNEPDSDGKGKTLIHVFTVSTEVPYTFDYGLTAGTHTVTCSGINSTTPITLKLSGVFDATVSLYNSCSTIVFSETVSTNEVFGPSVSNQDRSITRTVPADEMKIGQYHLVKTIRINEVKLQNYLSEYLSNKDYTCVLTDDHFLNEAIKDIDFAGCDISCDDCKSRITGLINEMETSGDTLTEVEKSNLFERCEAVCMENITCLSSLYNMIASVSPDGQFGQVRRMPAGLENSTNLDMNNLSENFDESSRDFPVGSDGGSPALEASSALVPHEFPLSIFNSNNTLLPNYFLRTENNEFYRANWRKPLAVTVTGYSKENYKNQVIFEADLTNATYNVTDYKDENGEIVYVIVQPLDNGGYSPDVVPGAPIVSAEDPLNPDLKKVPLRYLADDRDFIRRFKDHFANYLVPYHPEFSYYVQCSSLQRLNSFEERLIDKNDIITAAEFLEKETNSDYYITKVLATDPIFHPNTINEQQAIDNDLRQRLRNKVLNYDYKYDQNGQRIMENNLPQFYSMAQYATVMINCPNPQSTCKRDNCDNGKFLSTDVEEWMMFKSLYLTERQKVLRENATRRAIQGRYYNGCIGNTSFNRSPEEARLHTYYDLDNRPSREELRNTLDLICDQTSPQDEFSMYDDYRWRRLCNYPNTFHLTNHFFYRLSRIPFYDPNQTCNRSRASLYANKIRAFYPPLPGTGGSGNENGKCYEIATDREGKGLFIPTDCNLSLLDQGSIMGNAAAIRSYRDCGLCPMANQVKDFFTDLIDYEVLNSSAVSFNCITSPIQVSIGQELESNINPNLQSTVLYNWTGTFNQSTKILSGVVTTTPSGTKSLEFTLDLSNSGITEYSWSTNTNEIFKRIKIAGISLNPPANNSFKLTAYLNLNTSLRNDFTATASILSGADNGRFTSGFQNMAMYRYEFEITGTFSVREGSSTTPVNIASCTFAPLCQTTPYPGVLLSLLNTLVYTDDTDVDDDPSTITPLKPYDLYQAGTTPVSIMDADVYEDPVRPLIGMTAVDTDGDYVQSLNNSNVTWSSNLNAGVLTGVLSHQFTGSKALEIKIIPIQYPNSINNPDFTRIHSFTNVRPFEINCSEPGKCYSNKFLADAIVEEDYDGNANSHLYYKVLIEVTSKTDGVTDNILPTATICEKIDTQR